MADNWVVKLEAFVRAYRKGHYTALEAREMAIDLMPEGEAALFIAHLPDDLVQALRHLAAETASWTDNTWDSLIGIRGPDSTPNERRMYRRKLVELRAYLSTKGKVQGRGQ
jgi:hypothetical protein